MQPNHESVRLLEHQRNLKDVMAEFGFELEISSSLSVSDLYSERRRLGWEDMNYRREPDGEVSVVLKARIGIHERQGISAFVYSHPYAEEFHSSEDIPLEGGSSYLRGFLDDYFAELEIPE